MLATLTVNVDFDGVVAPNDGDLTLREAIAYVNGSAVPQAGDLIHINGTPSTPGVIDEIVFSTDPNDGLNGGTILLDNGNVNSSGQELSITESVIIDATMLSSGLTIKAHDLNPTVNNGGGTRVFNITGSSNIVTMEGLTLTGGDAFGDGGAIRSESSLIIRHSTIVGNRSTGDGGGLYVQATNEDTKVLIENSTIEDNHASESSGRGGGVFLEFALENKNFSNYPDSGFFIKESIINQNSARDGGGVFVGLGTKTFSHNVAKEAVFDVLESVVSGNTAINRGGGIYLYAAGGSLSKIQNSSISGNDAGFNLNGTGGPQQLKNSGGGLYAYLMSGPFEDTNSGNMDSTLVSSLTISGSTIDTNTAGHNGGGVAICAKRGGLLSSKFGMVNSTVSGNVAGATTDPVTELGTGGGIHFAVPTYTDDKGEGLDSEFDNVTITNNTAGSGAGIYSQVLSDSTFEENGVLDTRLRNTIVSGNKDHSDIANNFFGSINADETQFNLIGSGSTFNDHETVDPVDGRLVISFSDLGAGNINDTDNDPGLLALDFYGGLTKTHMLKASSDARDAGNPNDVANQNGVPEFDQRGNPQPGTGYDRVLGATPPTPSVIDIGAVEFILGDYNYNGTVDAADYTVWRDAYANPMNTSLDADGNGNGIIDVGDHLIWADNFSNSTAFGTAIGDYNDDNVVDHLDHAYWAQAYGTGDLQADGNNDGVVDAADYTVWRDHAGSTITTGNNTTANLRFQFLSSTSGVIYVVSTTADELDGDHSFGDLSLREAIQMANATTNATILVVAGRYTLTRTGTEAGDASYNDLDISSDVKVIGDGAGVTVIEGFSSSYNGTLGESEVFHVTGANADFTLESLTVTGGYNGSYGGTTLQANAGTKVRFEEVAIVNSNAPAYGIGVGIYAVGADVTILGSVFTNLTGVAATSVVASASNGLGSLTIGDSIFALNSSGFLTANVYATSVVMTNLGNNLYDDASGGFFDTTPGVGDHLGTPDYVVTTVSDTFDHTNNAESLSVREAIDLSNQASGQQEIWLPAWDFILTRDRQTYGGGSATDIDIAFGDLDISDDLIIRGVAGQTSVAWKAGIVDAVFDLLGDYNNSGQADYNNVSAADSTVWTDQNGSGSGTSIDWEVYAADGDDDGDVDQDDRDIWLANYGNSLDLFDIAVG